LITCLSLAVPLVDLVAQARRLAAAVLAVMLLPVKLLFLEISFQLLLALAEQIAET
jgi:hypothetical protein